MKPGEVDPEETGCTVDIGSLARMLSKGDTLYFHAAPTVLDEDGESEDPDVELHLTSVSLISGGGGEEYVELPQGGLYVNVPFSQIATFLEN
jgi:hypothetical protein